MDVISSLRTLINVCILFGSLGLLNLENEELICMYIECLAICLCLQDTLLASKILEDHLDPQLNILNYSKIIDYYESCLKLTLRSSNSKNLEGLINLKLGDKHLLSGNYYKSIEHCKNSLEIARETGAKTLEAASYVCIGQAYIELHELSKAMKCFQKTLDMNIPQNAKYYKMLAYGAMGNAHVKSDSDEEAIVFLEKCLTIAEELGCKAYAGRAYVNLGSVFSGLREFDKGIDYCQRALRIALEISDKYLEALACGIIGSNYQSQYKYDEAILYLEKSVTTAKEIGSKKQEAAAYIELGETLYLIDENPKAKECFQNALDIYEVTGDKYKEGTVYRCLGKVSLQMGKYDDAIKYLDKALDIAVSIKDKKGEVSAFVCLGNLYHTLGRSREAIEYFLKRLDFAVQSQDRDVQATIHGNLGHAYVSVGNIQNAVQCYEKQLKISIETGAEVYKGVAYTNLARILVSEGNYLDGIIYLEKGLETAVRMNDKLGEEQAHEALGDCYFALQKYSEAMHCYETALAIARDMRHKYIETMIISRLGRLYFEIASSDKETRNEDHYRKSEMYLKEAIEGFDLLFHRLNDQDEFKIYFFKEFLPTYSVLIEVLLETQQTEEALMVSERGRGRSLSDLLVSKYFISRQDAAALGTSPFLNYDELQEFLQRSKLCILFYTAAYRCVIWVLVHSQPVRYYIHHKKEDIQLFHRSLRSHPLKSRNILPSFVNEVYVEMLVSEAYDKMRVRDAGINCEDRSLDAHKTRRTGDEEQVEATSCSDQVIGDSPSASRFPIHQQTNCSDQVIGDSPSASRFVIHQQLQELSLENSEEITNMLKSRHPLEKLFDILVAPVENHLTQEEIVIIPQGPLYLVPFAAIRDPKTGLYLYQTKRIRLAPSITTLKTLQECPADYHSTNGALVIGNPNVEHVMFKGKEHTFCPLPSAENEADFISMLLGVTALTGLQATKQEVKDRLTKGVAVIHIAAHADSQNGEIALAPSESAMQKGIPEEEDYLLTMKEVQQIGIRAKLVVLSCCHSGRGDIEPEGVVGMSRAFLAAGARAVIASLWAVNDFVTFSFMVSLYGRLRRGHTASASLQQAMEEIRAEGYTDPKFWAPFFLIGDDVTIT